MRKELNEIANQLTELAAKYEEVVAPPKVEWKNSAEWTALLKRYSNIDDDARYLDLEGKSPIEAVKYLYSHLQDAWEHAEYLERDIAALRSPTNQQGWRDRIAAAPQAQNTNPFFSQPLEFFLTHNPDQTTAQAPMTDAQLDAEIDAIFDTEPRSLENEDDDEDSDTPF